MIIPRSKNRPVKVADKKVSEPKEKKEKVGRVLADPTTRDTSTRNYMVWFNEHKDNVIEDRGLIEFFRYADFRIDDIIYVKDVIKLVHACFEAYYNGIASSGCLSPEVFSRCRNVTSKYSLADILEGRDDIYACVLYKIFVKDAEKWLRGSAHLSPRGLGDFFLLKCCSDMYSFVGGFDIKLYEATLKQYLPMGGKLYDPSMGWGHRIYAAQKYDVVEYYGTDPSTDMAPYYHQFAETHPFKYPPHIYTQGSEVFIPEMEGQMDLTCTCPPYYTTEKYPSVDGWKSLAEYEDFVQKSCDNCYRYLKDDCWTLWFLGDSGNFPGFTLSDLYIKCLKNSGFKDVEKVYFFHGGTPKKSEVKTYWVVGRK